LIHPSAQVDLTATIGEGTRVWNFAQVREHAHIGRECMIGRGVYIGPGVVMGNRCKIQNGALLYQPARLGDGVFIGPRVVLTNDRHPRAILPNGKPVGQGDWKSEGVFIDDGASIGAGAVILGGVIVGKWAMVGAGAVVVASVMEHWKMAGVPARRLGWVCRCGAPSGPRGLCDECREAAG